MAKYQAYPEYKDSGVEWFGKVPENWNSSRLKFEATINMGQSPNSEDCNQEGVGVPFLQGNAEFGIKSPTPKQYCEVPRKLAKKGELLFSVRAPVGALNFSDQLYGIGRGLCSIDTKTGLNCNYLWWLISVLKIELDSVSTGSTFESVSAEQVGNVLMVLPPLIEQQTIANFLDHETAKIDTLIEKQQQLIQLLKEKRQAVISHAVTKGLNPDAPMKDSGVEWLGQVPEEWEVYKLKHACSEIFLGLTSKVDYVETNGVPLVRALNISGGVLDLTNAREISVEQHKSLTKNRGATRDDVLLSKSGTIGTAAIVDTDVEFSIYESIFALRAIKKILIPEYLLFFIQSSVAKAQYARDSVGMGVNHLNMPDIQDVQIPIPPIRDQELLLDKLYQDLPKFDQLVKKAEDSISFMYERRTALISAAVTGKIDVRNWQAPTN